jgi:hypothetical protein
MAAAQHSRKIRNCICGGSSIDAARRGGGFICNECVQLCVQAIGTERPEWLKAHKGFVEQLMKDKAD